MSKVLECTRELIVDKPADQVWEYISNLRNAMTANQFHLSIDCDDAVARAPKAGLEVPILHEIMGHRAYRIARITRFEDYAISWGERIPDDATYEDSFPHSEGWKIESLGSNRCRIQNHLRGRWMLPVGQLIGQHSWDIIIPPILDNDLQDVAFAAGVIDRKTPIEMPQVSGALLRLMHTLQIDGNPARDVLKVPPLAPKQAPGH